jgi:hypothetical protein
MRALALVAGCTLLAVDVMAASAASRGFDPDPMQPETATWDGRTWKAAGDGYELRLRAVEAPERLERIRAATGVATDPFASPPDVAPAFLSFLVEVRNLSPNVVVFEPQRCWLTPNTQETVRPIGLERLASDYRFTGRELPAAYGHVAAVVLENATLVESGGTLSGLLVYHAPGPGTKRFRIDVPLTLGDGSAAKLSATYRRKKA